MVSFAQPVRSLETLLAASKVYCLSEKLALSKQDINYYLQDGGKVTLLFAIQRWPMRFEHFTPIMVEVSQQN